MSNKLKICVFSDTHNKYTGLELPQCDIAIFAGDATGIGYKHELQHFLSWFNKQHNATYKIFISGNHDRCFDTKYDIELESNKWLQEVLNSYGILTIKEQKIEATHDQDFFYLENGGINILGLNIWGSPHTPWFHGDRWAFNKHRGEDIQKEWNKISNNTDILITHGPSLYNLDYSVYDKINVGCENLRRTIEKIKPKYHIFGHLHENYGIKETSDTIFINCCLCDLQYNRIREPILFEIELNEN